MRPVKGSPEDKWSSELCKEGIICVNGRFVCDRDLCSRLNGGFEDWNSNTSLASVGDEVQKKDFTAARQVA